jgi:hypothetical protein
VTRALSPFARANLDRQGFEGLDEPTKTALDLPLRFTPALCLTLTAVGVATRSAWLLALLAAGAGVAAASGTHPFDVVYNSMVRRATAGPPLPPAPPPRRLAFILATPVLAAAAVAFTVGASSLGTAVGVAQAAGCGVYVTTGWCPASFAHGKLFGPVGNELAPAGSP